MRPAPAPEVAPEPIPIPDDAEDDGSGRRRSKTIARKQMLRERRRMLAQGMIPEVVEYDRPMQRSDCRDGERPCLFVSCRHHLYLDVNPVTGSIKLNFPDKEVWELAETCALDVAERGGITLEEVGEIMNLTRERIRQVEVSGLEKLKAGDASLETFLDGHELID
ncbi:MAG: DNA-binding protein [Deltaproteobacteria bacterium]|nr:DNA-binding protein [Deltaproteobacteria bacterium]